MKDSKSAIDELFAFDTIKKRKIAAAKNAPIRPPVTF